MTKSTHMYWNYPFMVTLDRCNRSCNAIDDDQVEYLFWIKQETKNLLVVDMITGVN